MTNRKRSLKTPSITRLANAKSLMMSARDSLQILNIPPFGSDMPLEASSCYNSLVVNRFSKRIPSGTCHDPRSVAFRNYLDYDSQLAEVKFNIWDHYDLRKQRLLLSKWFAHFRDDIDYSILDFSPGESFIGQRGETSVIAKLSERKHWTTTWNCLEDTVKLIYKNRVLKLSARRLIGRVSREDRYKLYLAYKNSGNPGFLIFRELLIQRVLIIQDGARGSSVPKTAETDRFINIECMFPMLLQRIVAAAIKRVLRRVGNAIDPYRALNNNKFGAKYVSMDAQELHSILIKDSRFATIDFSNASDSIAVDTILSLFPNNVSDLLLRYRSNYVSLKGDLHQPYKLSSMGNGFTFEVMTILLYSLSSVLTPFSRVFGDDVIIPNSCSKKFIELCSVIGFVVNNKKTFINSPFRESCGAFYHDDIGYIKSYDFELPSNDTDIILICNKLAITMRSDMLHTSVRDIFAKLHEDLSALFPASQKGPFPSDFHLDSNLGAYIYDPNWKRKQMKSTSHLKRRSRAIDAIKGALIDIQIEPNSLCFVRVPAFKSSRSHYRDPRLTYYLSIDSGQHYIGRKRGRGKWLLLDCFVDDSGRLFLLRTLQGRKTDVNIGGKESRPFGHNYVVNTKTE